jgi:hypothetical protein
MPCKITDPTDKISGNESKTRFMSKNSQFYCQFLPSKYLTKKQVNLSNFWDTLHLSIMNKRTKPSTAQMGYK